MHSFGDYGTVGHVYSAPTCVLVIDMDTRDKSIPASNAKALHVSTRDKSIPASNAKALHVSTRDKSIPASNTEALHASALPVQT